MVNWGNMVELPCSRHHSCGRVLNDQLLQQLGADTVQVQQAVAAVETAADKRMHECLRGFLVQW